MSGQSRKTQTQRRQESEQALLESAADVIMRDGVNGVTFETLAEAGGFSRGLASSRFGSKAKLIEQLLKALHERQEHKIAEKGFDDLDGLGAILGYVETGMADMAKRKETRVYSMLLSSSVANSTDSRVFFAETHEAVRQRLENWVRRGQEDGTVRAEVDAPSTALIIGCMMFGAAMQMLVNPQVDLDTLRRSSISLLSASLSAVPADQNAETHIQI